MANTTATDALSLPWEMLIDKSIPFGDIEDVKYAGIDKWIYSLAKSIEKKGSWWHKPKQGYLFKDLYTYDELLNSLIGVALCAARTPTLKKHDCKLMLDTLIDLNRGNTRWMNDTVGKWAIIQVTDGFVIRYQIQGMYKHPVAGEMWKK